MSSFICNNCEQPIDCVDDRGWFHRINTGGSDRWAATPGHLNQCTRPSAKVTARIDVIKEALAHIDAAWTLLCNESILYDEVFPVLKQEYPPDLYPLAYRNNLLIIRRLINQPHDIGT